ncbi:hypothetical protein XELAEV_18024078mg [Xenopus laevis]|uniref:Uncharacterized protein n=1 Tax=Xenopus laevis TaxID=8355 RepID=A0A974HPS7_XENLA|nr:hypothetical protein XELAEV_18024078mg [Xenopus laevis]
MGALSSTPGCYINSRESTHPVCLFHTPSNIPSSSLLMHAVECMYLLLLTCESLYIMYIREINSSLCKHNGGSRVFGFLFPVQCLGASFITTVLYTIDLAEGSPSTTKSNKYRR